jgi:hypothetical protein
MAGVLLLLFLGIDLVATSHRLHQAIHPDAATPTHQCVFVRVSSGHCLTQSAPVLVCLPAQEVTVVSCEFSPVVLPSCDYVHLPGRAPPVFSV